LVLDMSNTVTGGDLVAKMFKREGVRHIFTLSGLHVAPIYDGCLNEGVEIVDTRHEQAAAHAADAYARLTRGIGVAVVTAGPGVTDAVTGIANAKHAESPVLLIGGAAPQALATKGALQETEQVDLFKPITKFAQRVERAELLPSYVASAFRAMTTGRPGPAFLEMPWDIISENCELDRVHMPMEYRPKRGGRLADASLTEEAAKRLMSAERPVIMTGNAVHWDESYAEALELAHLVDAPLFFNGMARSCFDAADPRVFSKARREALLECDAILLVGAPLDFRLGYGTGTTIAHDATVISIDIDGQELGRNRDVQIPLIGDSKSVLQQISRCAKKSNHAAWLEKVRAIEEKSLAKQRQREQSNDVPITHFRFARAVADAIDDETIVVADGGNIVSVTAKVLERKVPGTWLDPGPFGCLGVGAPFALAAKLLFPKRKVLVVQGDGSFGLNGFDYDTCLRFNCPVTAVVGNDAAWGQIWLPQKAIYGEKRAVGTLLRPTRYDKVVEGLGGIGFHVEKPDEITPCVKKALASNTVACVDVTIDRLALEGAGGGAYAI
jgi:acetolactate synthase-1/2/3 large subunit